MQDKSLIKNISKGVNSRLGKIFSNPYSAAGLSWLKVKYYKHATPADRKHMMFGHSFYFRSPTEFLHGIKEIFVDRIYEQQLPSRPLILDCGANIGLSVVYLKQQHPDARIIAFEPDENNFALLKKNVDSFGFGGVELRQQAVWVENTTLYFRNESSMSSRIDTSHEQGTKVQATRLKDEINQRVDFLKMDIEGAEFAVLSDLDEKLDQVSNLFIEYHGTFGEASELSRLFTILSDSGFSYYIKEAAPIYPTPFNRKKNPAITFDVQLNIFCFRGRG